MGEQSMTHNIHTNIFLCAQMISLVVLRGDGRCGGNQYVYMLVVVQEFLQCYTISFDILFIYVIQ